MNQPDLFSARAAGSLEKARAAVKAGRHKGITCPVCERVCKVHRRPLNRTMALGLVSLVNVHRARGRPIHVSEIPLGDGDVRTAGGEFSKLAVWRLIQDEETGDGDEKKRTSGRWVPTSRGVSFVLGRLKVPRWVEQYRGEAICFAAEEVSIDEVLEDERFDWRKVRDAITEEKR